MHGHECMTIDRRGKEYGIPSAMAGTSQIGSSTPAKAGQGALCIGITDDSGEIFERFTVSS